MSQIQMDLDLQTHQETTDETLDLLAAHACILDQNLDPCTLVNCPWTLEEVERVQKVIRTTNND